MDIREKLNYLAKLQAEADKHRLHYEELRAEIIPAEVREQLADIDAEAADILAAVNASINQLAEEIKADVIAVGSSVKGDHLQAVFAKGRVLWDTKALDGFATAHPEIMIYRKEGNPSVSIRNI